MKNVVNKSEKQDVYSRVTSRIIAELEKGVKPWEKPWNAEHAAGRITRPLRHNGVPYGGVNVLMLWLDSVEKGFNAPIWMTFKQADELGAHVKKGEHGSFVCYANAIIKKGENPETGEEDETKIPFMKAYTVFNVEQIEGLPAQYYALATDEKLEEVQRIATLEFFIKNLEIDLHIGGNRAFYRISDDSITMPPFEAFKEPEAYYSTLLHEATHWTRHPSRLDRDFGRKRWGDEGYAMEELVAELGSAFLCADLNSKPENLDDHASYIDSWLEVLKRDTKAIFTASGHAQRAAELLKSKQPAVA
jgi:antirestriction protein ArdC